jgi:DNA-binding transcriptional ArsR family regulator
LGSLAHIGNIPVEEWLPFLVPVIALYLFGRRRERRRRAEVEQLPPVEQLLDAPTAERVVATLRAARHGDAAAKYLPLLYPPGPDGMTVAELAAHAHVGPERVERLLDELEELGYVELEGDAGTGQRVGLTLEGYGLVSATEAALVSIARERAMASQGR